MLRRGAVDLPLHGGRCPRWLFEKMVRLSRAILLLIVEEFGREELLKRLTDPMWFQALGCLLGFDWHSSGLTTTVGGAIKQALKPCFKEIGIFICGGKGKTALSTPKEIEFWAEKCALSNKTLELTNYSRLAARIDNNAIQDGFSIYYHLFVFTKDGSWGVIQQGMDEISGYARRYHWYSCFVKDPCVEPHSAIVSQLKKQLVLNLVAKESFDVQQSMVKLLQEDLSKVMKELKLFTYGEIFRFKEDHRLDIRDLKPESLKKVWEKTYNNPPEDFKRLILTPGLGAKSLRALTLAAEIIYDVKASRKDPAVYSYAHGGKDGHPYKVNKKIYENTIVELEEILKRIKVGEYERAKLFKRLPRLFYSSQF
ncbi:MAG: DUF763 domain-containing protein [Thermodesulfobacteria bacterium]|nr:DUF763 domain-containing protein [Thermodesulfobacteriota bacterium]